MTATYGQHCSETGPVLFLAFELGWEKWRLAFGTGLGGSSRQKSIAARDLDALSREISRAKKHFGLPENASIVSCYEAGRDGFWLHRYLLQAGIENHVVDSSSIEVNRRARRAKFDRMDADKLLTMLMRYEAGERKAWSVVNAPAARDEAARHLHRELLTLKKDRTRHTNRIKGWLAGCGLKADVNGDLAKVLPTLRQWDGSPVSPQLQQRIARELARRDLGDQQIRDLTNERARIIRNSAEENVEKVRRLEQIRGVGANSAWLYVMEFFGWRKIRNRRELGSLAGLTPTPHDSGTMRREQGISKAGNRRIRAMAIEIAWGWLRFQPQSELSRWFQERFGSGGSRMRKVGIVALARKLLIKLWQYLETGVLPDGAILKPQ